MTANKYNRIKRLSRTAKFYYTFQARLADIPDELLKGLTSKEIAEIIDGPMELSYIAGLCSHD